MEPEAPVQDYIIWGIDDSPYGPVPLSILVDWIGDQRVVAETWVFARGTSTWKTAQEMNELKDYFNPETELASISATTKRFKPGSLRRIKILGEMKDAQLAHLADFLDFKEILQHKVVVTQGEPGDAMFLVMSGELRARTMIGGRETILTTFAAGDFFGEMSLFDQGPRSADVVANVDSTVLKLSSQAFERLTREMPSLATPFLQAISRTLSARIRADNKRLTRVTQQFSASSND